TPKIQRAERLSTLCVFVVSHLSQREISVRVERLSNGLRLVLKENHNKNIIALCGYIDGGSRTEDDSIKGLSHYYEHIIFRGGTPNQAELETRRAFQSLGDYGG